MACTKQLSMSLKEDDTPLDEAIYVSSVDKIFGCRGKWVYKFNAATGKKEAESRWVDDVVGISSICEFNGLIYICGYRSMKVNYPNIGQPWRSNRDLFTVNPTTLASTNTNILKTFTTDYDNGQESNGAIKVVSAGTKIAGLFQYSSGAWGDTFFSVDPSNVAGFAVFGGDTFGFGEETCGQPAADVVYDSFNNVIVFARQGNNRRLSQYSLAGVSLWDTPFAFNKRLTGVCYSAINDSYYCVDNTLTISKVSAADFTIYSFLNILDAAANPWRIFYNPYDAKIYVPEWNNDIVQVVDPLTDTVVATKTGFNDPIRCVFTPTKKFAVQNSGVSLREIT